MWMATYFYILTWKLGGNLFQLIQENTHMVSSINTKQRMCSQISMFP
jgi:hypothetical protein